MKPQLLLLFGFLLTASLAIARVGASEVELAAKFGQPVYRGTTVASYQGVIVDFCPKLIYRTASNWTIACEIVDGRCAQVSYQKPGQWTEEQIAAVLTSNAQGATWTDVSKPNTRAMQRDWRRSDSATAVMNSLSFTVTTPAYLRAKAKAEAKAKGKMSEVPQL